jgi:hypothetical protein
MERAELLSKIKKILEKQGARRKFMQKDKHDSVSRASSLINLTLPALETMPSINEAAVIKQYSVQAVGRKRNTMMNAMQLDDAEFLNWVQDRLYRLAHENERPVSEFTVKDLTSGLQQWESLFSSQDKDWGKYRDSFMKYRDRFIKAATVILNTAQASGSLSEPPSKAAPNNTEGSPASPTMVKYQATDGGRSGEAAQSTGMGGGGAEQEEPQQYGPMEYFEYFQQLLNMDDASFADFVQDKLLSSENAPTKVSAKTVKKMLDKDEQEVDKVFQTYTKEIHKLYKEYAKRFLQTVQSMTSEEE